MNRAGLIVFGTGFVAGAAVAWAAMAYNVERTIKTRVDEEVASMERVFKSVYTKATDDVLLEQALEDEDESQLTIDEVVDHFRYVTLTEEEPEEVRVVEDAGTVAYNRVISAVETDIDTFVSGEPNYYGVSYIEEEEYLDEDGRAKNKIDILMDDHNPIFLMDGIAIDDWHERVGDSILVDFYKLVPPGLDRVLYVRNHRTDEDYEVVQVSP